MSQDSKVRIFLRAPRLPALILSKDELLAGVDAKSLVGSVARASPHKTMSPNVHVVDSSGEEFWFIPDQRTLAPGFFARKWTKKKIIDVFNSSSNAVRLGIQYPSTGISNKSLAQVVSDVVYLVERSFEKSGGREGENARDAR